jgi:phage host-nuclease inhibitor protein Gam
MKKLLPVFAVLLFTALVACNNSEKKERGINLTPQAQADSLEKEVDDGHMIAMVKYMKIPDLQKEIKRLADSISKLPAKAQEAAAPYKEKLNSLDKELAAAYDSMENWMEAFGNGLDKLNKVSMKDSIEQRIKFFTEEKTKINSVKEAVLGSVKKADSLLKEKL